MSSQKLAAENRKVSATASASRVSTTERRLWWTVWRTTFNLGLTKAIRVIGAPDRSRRNSVCPGRS